MIRVLAQIGTDHRRIAAYFGGCPLGDLTTVIENQNTVGSTHDDTHVMLDQQDRDFLLVADRPQETVEPGRFARVQTGGGLVEAKDRRFGAHRPRDLQTPLIAIGEISGIPIGTADQADPVEPAARPIEGLAFGAAKARQAQQAANAETRSAHQPVMLRRQ